MVAQKVAQKVGCSAVKKVAAKVEKMVVLKAVPTAG
jgi:hypothetical protein